jgi:DNA-directed RNA polymerase subunit RPC12/RpoP
MDKRILTQPFSKEQIKKRKGKKNMVYPYIKTEDVLKRFLESTNSYSIKIKEHMVFEKEAVVLITLDLDGQIIESFGNSAINDSIGDSLKAAQSDAIKKAAHMANIPCIFHVSQEVEQEDIEEPIEEYLCADCGSKITQQIANYSKRFGKPLCMRCQQKYKNIANNR